MAPAHRATAFLLFLWALILCIPLALAQDPEHSVLWLRGVIGSGKSTIANSLSDLFRNLRYLGAFLFFDSKSRYERKTFVSTLAYQLAEFDQKLGERIADAVKLSKAILRAPLQVQFNTFVLGPLQSAKLDDLHQPMLIIIDGLDQCGDIASRKELLKVFSNANPPLPNFLRVIITSQPDPDTSKLLANFVPMELDTTSEGNHDNIELYFTDTFSQSWKEERGLHQDWPGQDRLSKLVQRAGGLFLWSVVAANSIIYAPNPEEQIDDLLNNSLSETELDDIYLKSLKSIPGCKHKGFAPQFKAVVGMIINAREPLSSATIEALRGCDSTGDETQFIITRLSSVLSFPTSTRLDAPIRTLHSSFDDFLCDRNKCGDEWYIDIALHHWELAIGCLKYLSRYFEGADPINMADPFPREAFMNTLRDKKLRDKAVCVDALAYTATYWPYHFCAISNTQTDMESSVKSPVKEVDDFLQQNLLHWFEFLSILNKSREASRMLGELCQGLARLSSGNSDVMKMAEDAR
ncbi:hypothetical protein FIBSPDRAFT_955162 [Athelia psychrophila]|uniref:Nephrocystin 3-like N-terminal domain-containing protein n=1 Tax=Athelia psychrophila TaxID=1759441 RepID=A0A166ID83_9AGAM|nr:hypothetical protein FIBSPDRAFT_955162 [Fibularhizoctonia sp. CBS 109695]